MRRRAVSNATAPESLMSALMQGAYSLVYVIIIIIIIILIVLITMIIIRLFWSTLRVPMEASHGFRLTDKRQQQDRWLLQMLITMMIIWPSLSWLSWPAWGWGLMRRIPMKSRPLFESPLYCSIVEDKRGAAEPKGRGSKHLAVIQILSKVLQISSSSSSLSSSCFR